MKKNIVPMVLSPCGAAKPFFFPQVNMQGITKLGFTFLGFRRLLSLISMEVRFGPTRKI